MEDIPGLPEGYFGLAVSIYALGWTVNLKKTLSNVNKLLTSNGSFVFPWEHPIHSLLEYENGKLSFRLSYLSEQYEKHESWRSVPIVMNDRKFSTYINTITSIDFIVDQVIEESRIPEHDQSKP
jgi:hypothetical protein